MREIKFRAWDKWKEQMVCPNDGDFIGWHAMSNWRECLEVMQYTGLKDKNGVEIHEGDIVRVPKVLAVPCHVGVVEYIRSGFVLTGLSHDETWAVGSFNQADLAWIGNIYENPELLENADG